MSRPRQRNTSGSSNDAEKKYKSFAETFKISGFCLAVNMIYPCHKNQRKRFSFAALIVVSLLPGLVMIVWEIFDSFMVGDLDNTIRQITVLIPFVGIAIKIFCANLKRHDFEKLLNIVSSDLIATNELAEEYQLIVDKYILSGKTGQHAWLVMSLLVTGVFPVVAAVLMMHHNLTHNETKRYMLHELEIPGLRERKYDSPYFEIVFAYMVYCLLNFIASFTGYDGTFCICVNHATMKLKLLSHKLAKIFEDNSEVEAIKRELRVAIVEHREVVECMKTIQRVYGLWLAAVFGCTLFQICVTLYQVTATEHIDPRSLIFVVGSVNHIYIPCYYAATLKQAASDLSTEVYCCGWEQIMDKWVTDNISFMVARAQLPVEIRALGMLSFDMELFVLMCRTSYSMYTLLSSGSSEK